jgi:lipoprotein-anchoring transpeptidase ErfK/SrfK
MAWHLDPLLQRVATLLAVLLVSGGPSACAPRGSKPDGAPRARMAEQLVPSDYGRPEVASSSVVPSTYLVLRLKERRLELMNGEGRVASFPIAVGRTGHETPTGRFQVEEKVVRPDFPKVDPNDPTRLVELIPPGPTNPLGERWIGFAHGEGWTVGIHGTPHPELLGQAVSGGCIRMRNADVIRVFDEVELGTSVVVHP